MSKQLLRVPQVIQLIGLSKPHIYCLMRAGKFPRPFKIGERAVAWDAEAVQGWINDKIAAGSAPKHRSKARPQTRARAH